MDYLYKADLPYVEVEKSVKSPFEVRLLMPVYGGKGSETTAIMGYIFQSYALADKEPEISKCLEQIAISEMRHHDLIGTAIVRLGGIPYIGDNRGYWQGGYVNYTLNARGCQGAFPIIGAAAWRPCHSGRDTRAGTCGRSGGTSGRNGSGC